MNAALFSSKSDEWETPQDFFDDVSFRWGPFTLDVCATAENSKCDSWYDKKADALTQVWDGSCWMNPPYGRQIGKWIAKAWASVRDGTVEQVTCLLPARTDTAWFHEIVKPYAHVVEFVRGRLKFGGSKNSAPFPSMVVVFRRSA